MPGIADLPRRQPGQPRVPNARKAFPPTRLPQCVKDGIANGWPAPQGDEDPRVRKAAWMAEDPNNGRENREQRVARQPDL